ncbi:MAG: DNA internalization-related competence protein ComEC/Rec2 [Epulopiscium sp.]|nr:DNA internalization-related competence protein ComEC/Rec2 [Candidatus Epulonipiscium sp.]
MKRPLIWIFLMYLLGILGGWYCLNLSSTILFFSFIFVIVIILYKKTKWNGILVFPLFLLFGYIQIELSFIPKDVILEEAINKNSSMNVKVKGVIEDIKDTGDGQISCIIKSSEILCKNKIHVKPIKIKLYTKLNSKIEYGNIVQVDGKIMAFEPLRNPGGWNEVLYMKTQGIDYKMFGDLISIKPDRKNFRSYLQQLRGRFFQVYDKLLPFEQSSIIKAMIIGEKSTLGKEQKLIYQQAGISHILAISGLHISIIALFLWWIFKALRAPAIVSTISIVSFLWIYCVFTGFGVSTVRAVLMITLTLSSKIIRRSYDVHTSIVLAAFIILIKQPLYLWNAGFQLSFAAVLGLIFLGPLFNRIFWIPEKIRKILSPSMGAGLATLPIVAYHFYYISLIGFILNLIIVPLSTFVVGFGFLGGVVGLFWIQGARFIIGIVYYILCFYEYIAKLFIRIPHSNLITGATSLWQIFVYYTTIFVPILYFYYKREYNLNKKILGRFGIICLLLWGTFLFKNNKFEVVFLDVGQGDSAVIHTENNKNLLIDGGDKGCQKVILPYLHYKGITSLDGVFLSHPDKDHLAGLVDILDYIDIKKIYVSVENDGKDKMYHQFISKAKSLDIPCYFLKKGEEISIDKIHLICLYPQDNHMKKDGGGWNKVSMVFQIQYGTHTFLFTGDIEKEQENNILRLYKPIQTDFLKVPHHGSKTSSTEDFIRWCNPQNAIISCSKNNRYSHPHKEVIERLSKNNINTITTSNNGAVMITSNGKEYAINTMIQNRGNVYEAAKRRIEKRYFSFIIFILWGGAVLKKVLSRKDNGKTSSL